MTNKFAERLRLLIKDNKLKYKDVEAKTGIKAYTIRNYVNNICEPDIKSLLLLSDLFNVSTDYLVGYSDSLIPEHLNQALLRFKQELLTAAEDFNSQIALISANHKRRC